MDLYGIGNAVKGMMLAYTQASRRTGRTTSMLDGLKDGDRIYFANSKEADRVRRLAKERNIDIQCFVISPSNPEKVFQIGSAQGRAVFDHGWVEQYYLNLIERAAADIDYFERQTSGVGEPHLKTLRKAAKYAGWRIDDER